MMMMSCDIDVYSHYSNVIMTTINDDIASEESSNTISSSDQYNVSISTVKMMFTHAAVKKRAHLFACNILNENPSEENDEQYKSNYLYKGYFNLCYELLTKEYNFIRSQVRICQKRKLRKIRKVRKKRELTKYTIFCRELKAQYSHEELVGTMHKKWQEHKADQLKLQAMKRPKKEDDKVASLSLTYDNGEILSDTSSDDSDDEKTSIVID